MAQGPRRAAAKLADELAQQIADGELKPGLRLPAARQLAQDRGIALNTAHAAMRQLQERGLVTATNRGTFVTDNPDTATTVEPAEDISAGIDSMLRDVQERLAAIEGKLGQLQETVNALETDPAPSLPDLGLGD